MTCVKSDKDDYNELINMVDKADYISYLEYKLNTIFISVK